MTENKAAMAQQTQAGRAIESQSFTLIDALIAERGGHHYSALQWPIVRRAIHTSGDLEFSELFEFSPQAVESGITALRRGASIICDVSMIVSGVNRKRLDIYQNTLHCFIQSDATITRAAHQHTTRAVAAMDYAAEQGLLDGAIVAIGNAPTALLRLLEWVQRGAQPALVIGLPVGFVQAAESKQALCAQHLCEFISCRGYKGGSPLVVATLHALLGQSV
ncbi:precorrin-8X methylmutase [Celerinatantimonas sp. YJH-8]|uniref:precorrin-8X methylmutase n=1 Tax=Celerinatantimonas sp. YJH-8 TaxID=3228714 RepID=UPI0038C5328B